MTTPITDLDPRKATPLILSAEEYFADAGITAGSVMAEMDEGDLQYLRAELVHHSVSLPDTPEQETQVSMLARFLVEAIEHELGGRWVRPHVHGWKEAGA